LKDLVKGALRASGEGYRVARVQASGGIWPLWVPQFLPVRPGRLFQDAAGVGVLYRCGRVSLSLNEPCNKSVSDRRQLATEGVLGGLIGFKIDDAVKRRPTRAPLRIRHLIFRRNTHLTH
jgi:hypothetical protein